MARNKVNPVTNFVRSGSLSSALETHAEQRLVTYFHYALTLKILIDQIYSRTGTDTPYLNFVSLKATDQVGTGIREKGNTSRYTFDKNQLMGTLPVTSFSSCDAAHFCNLGVQGNLTSLLGSNQEHALYSNLVAFAGDARILPQKVNVGPDRKIDVAHQELIRSQLQGSPSNNKGAITSKHNYDNYISVARNKMIVYRDSKNNIGEIGLAECAQSYINFYDRPQSYHNAIFLDFAKRHMNEIRHYKLTVSDYVAW
ncbi:hypothetical protein [Microbulbifer variabilis]|uniref:hypothetical protein n=1 Tax=Microbulbifer variabilis TaxID=266805 RepID=UPI001CFF3A95|nr:hypothetical protein [Microbulbifer variabilis]